jgi:hypothetical protein
MPRILLGLFLIALLTLSGCIFRESDDISGPVDAAADTSSNDVDAGGIDGADGDAAPTCSGGETLCDGACVDTNSNPDHCSACGNACPSNETNYAVACVSSSCETLEECAEGYADADGDSSNGCECELTDPADPPGDGADTNCDGIDGNRSAALFVKEGATGDGLTADTPMGSLSDALSEVAGNDNLTQVLVAQGSYPPFSLVSDVTIAGGYSGDFQEYDPSSKETVIEWSADATGEGDVTTVDATNVESTAVVSMRIIAVDAVDPGASTVAVHANNSDLELRALTLEGGQAADGADGAPVSGATSCSRHPGGTGGSPDTFNPCDFPQEDRAMSGGTGEPDDTTGGLGGSGGEHDCGGAVPLGNLTCSSSINAANDAEAGASGQDGTDGGVPPTGVGSIDNGFWEPRIAASPTAGTQGAGGGGGGAGGNCGSSTAGSRTGGSGGKGGPGGCGGKPGNNGLPGGASILVLSVGSEVTLNDVTGIPGTGGSGGEGSAGGVGEDVGNTSTLLGEGGTTAAGGAGGAGGNGGAGGDGGDGAGGCGGPSFGVAFDSASTITGALDIPGGETFDAGQSGNGANDAPNGCAGVSSSEQAL